MSAPRCLRIAIEACRPQRTSHLRLRSSSSSGSSSKQSRHAFSTTRHRHDKDNKKKSIEAQTGAFDVTAGFPMPNPGDVTMTEPVKEEKLKQQEKTLDADTAVSGKPKHTAASIQREQVKSEAVSETQAQKLRDIAAPPTSAATSSPPANAPPSSQSQTPTASRAFSNPSSKPLEPLVSSSPTSLTSTPAVLDENTKPNVPPNVLAAYRTPLYHAPTHGIPVAQLQLRSFSTRNLEFFADFCVRTAYYLSLPCTGPTPLPKKTERWTVLKSNFVNKKAQENFERITLKRLITVYDGAPEVVETWLAFVRRWQFYGVGMKANVWGWESLDVASKMDADYSNLEKDLNDKLQLFGFSKQFAEKRDLLGLLERQNGRREGLGMSQVRRQARVKDSDPW